MTVPVGYLLLPVLAFNVAAFAAQGWDKFKARRGSWRTPEATLLALGLPLSAPGMLLGMRVFRHKTSKASFKIKAAMVVFANLLMAATLGYLAMQGHVHLALALY